MIDILVLEPQRLIEHLGTQSRVSDRPLAIETPSIVARQVGNRNAANGTWSYPQNHTDIAKGIAKNTFEQTPAAKYEKCGMGTDARADKTTQMLYPPFLRS